MKPRHLVVCLPGSWPAQDGFLALTDKVVEGMLVYLQQWTGELTLLARRSGPGAENLGSRGYRLSDLPFDVKVVDRPEEALPRLRPDVVLAAFGVEHAEIVRRASCKVVLTAEMTPLERVRFALGGAGSRLARQRIRAGGLRNAATLLSMLRAVDGVQCNGIPVHRFVRRLNARSMLFFDTRLRGDEVRARAREAGEASAALRLGFSGRLLPQKGPLYAQRLTQQLNAWGYPASLSVFGDGPQRDHLTENARGETSFRGVLPFHEEWVPRVRAEIDVMVLPHTQGDPAGTYLEAAGLGVPVVGFDNVALKSLVDAAGIGWCVPMGDVRALAECLVTATSDPSRLDAAARRGVEFMTTHHFEREFTRRVEHLSWISQLD